MYELEAFGQRAVPVQDVGHADRIVDVEVVVAVRVAKVKVNQYRPATGEGQSSGQVGGGFCLPFSWAGARDHDRWMSKLREGNIQVRPKYAKGLGLGNRAHEGLFASGPDPGHPPTHPGALGE